MTRYFTSDLHLGHGRINELAGRPFGSVGHMDGEIIRRWNSVVSEADEVVVVGDLALGKLSESLALVPQLAGRKYLVPGNHDRCWSGNRRVRPDDVTRYTDVGLTLLPELWRTTLTDGEVTLDPVTVSHFPRTDRPGDDRYPDRHPPADGTWLLHGHTHQPGRIQPATREVHVGADAWDYTPVREADLVALIRAHI